MPSDRVKVLYITATLKDGLEGVTGKRNPSVANSRAFVIVIIIIVIMIVVIVIVIKKSFTLLLTSFVVAILI